MPKINFHCHCGGNELVREENLVRYDILARTYFDDDGPIIETGSFHTEKVNNSLGWETYRCYKCKRPLAVTNPDELWNWLAERNMLDYNN